MAVMFTQVGIGDPHECQAAQNYYLSSRKSRRWNWHTWGSTNATGVIQNVNTTKEKPMAAKTSYKSKDKRHAWHVGHKYKPNKLMAIKIPPAGIDEHHASYGECKCKVKNRKWLLKTYVWLRHCHMRGSTNTMHVMQNVNVCKKINNNQYITYGDRRTPRFLHRI